MKLRASLLPIAGALAALTVGSFAVGQVPDVKPGPEHALLKTYEGTWDATISSMGSESKGAVTYRVGVGGLWLIEDFKGEFAGTPFEGHGTTSYDAAKKKYVTVWVDSMSTSPMMLEGSYDKATKTMTLTGTMPMPDGTQMKVKETTVDKDADTRVFKLSGAGPDGKEMDMIEITYKRRKK